MADENTFIKQLNEAETANDTDIMIIEGEETKKISFLSLFNVFKEKFSKVYKPQTEITKAEYEALSEEEKNNNTMYLITDDNDMYSAGTVAYDNSGSGLSSVDVQGAIDEVSAKSVKNASDIGTLNTNCAKWVSFSPSITTALDYGGATYLILVAHNSMDTLNGLWLYRPGSSKAYAIKDASAITISGNGYNITVTASTGTPSCHYMKI